ncbi:MAG: hypothetical protein LBF63_09300 [Treponema sp.]|nr:hypothetical protein [Treponema sp.]
MADPAGPAFRAGEEGSIPPGLLAAAERVRGTPSSKDERDERSRQNGRHGKGGRPGKGRRRGSAPTNRGLRVFTIILTAIAVALVLVIGAGTLYVLLVDPGAFSGASSRTAPQVEDAAPAGGAADNAREGNGVSGTGMSTGMFTGIGRMRIAAGRRATVVLSIVFPYPPADRPFTEELAAKVPVFRQIARDYFGALSQDELDLLDEQKAKAEILRSFNNELLLGQIESLLFNDLLILE